MTAKRPGISLIVASSLVIAACGSDDAPTTGTTPVSSGKTPSYKAARGLLRRPDQVRRFGS